MARGAHRAGGAGAWRNAAQSALWQAPYESLMRDLEASGTPCRVCAQTGGAVAVGDLFSAQFVSLLPPGVDAFGENGEFHTLAEVWAASSDPLS